jgi:membrane-bound lytic murein transglycosylase B
MKVRLNLPRVLAACVASIMILSTSLQAETTTKEKASTKSTPKEFTKGLSEFINEMSKKHGFEKQSLVELMSKANYSQRVVDSMNSPYEAKPWDVYQPLFVTDERIKGGVEFWNKHADILKRAEKEYGVPPQIIVATIGVETKYGRFMGDYLVLDALTTLAFTYPKRQEMFRKQLESYILLLSEEDIDPEETHGSYAGAIGKPQFMPGSYRAYAVDFNGDGRRDLLNSTADAIGSVANYYHIHGWRKGELVTLPAKAEGGYYQQHLNQWLKPTTTIAELSKAGVEASQQLPVHTRCNLIQLDVGNKKELWLGFHNFYVITHYNTNNQYAMAVYQLSQKILEQRKAEKI